MYSSSKFLPALLRNNRFLAENVSINRCNLTNCSSSSSCTAIVRDISRIRGGGIASQWTAVAVAVATMSWLPTSISLSNKRSIQQNRCNENMLGSHTKTTQIALDTMHEYAELTQRKRCDRKVEERWDLHEDVRVCLPKAADVHLPAFLPRTFSLSISWRASSNSKNGRASLTANASLSPVARGRVLQTRACTNTPEPRIGSRGGGSTVALMITFQHWVHASNSVHEIWTNMLT